MRRLRISLRRSVSFSGVRSFRRGFHVALDERFGFFFQFGAEDGFVVYDGYGLADGFGRSGIGWHGCRGMLPPGPVCM